MIWLGALGPCGEHVRQFEMFAILQYVIKLWKCTVDLFCRS